MSRKGMQGLGSGEKQVTTHFINMLCHKTTARTSMRSDVTNSDSRLFFQRRGNKYLCMKKQIKFLPNTNSSHMTQGSLPL